jgi:glutamate:GABA antiporter
LLSGLVLRYKKPEVHRLYSVPGKKWGMWVAAIFGILSSIFVFALSFTLPQGFGLSDLLPYEVLLVGAIVISCAIPFIIYALKKPSWQKEVLTELKEEIHQSFNP